MNSGRRPGVAALVAWLLVGCGQSVVPGDPLLGTWRSDEFTEVYPGPPSTAQTVDVITFGADGDMTLVVTRRYPISAGDPYSGCVWIDRHTGWRWLRLDASASIYFGNPPDGSAQHSVERTGCVEGTRNQAPEAHPDGTGPQLAAIGYAIAGSTLTLSFEAPRPGQQVFTRVE